MIHLLTPYSLDYRCCVKNLILPIIKYDSLLFQKLINNSKIEIKFIDSGDGGFFIFDNPLLAFAFAIHFQEALTNYNTYHLYRKLRIKVGEISLRYSITYDSLFQFDDNFYGASIINNARILSKDKLNRCLIDQNTHDWFLKYFNSIEQLSFITDKDLMKVEAFKDYDFTNISNIEFSALSKKGKNGVQTYGIKNIYSQKIGLIKSKNTSLSIYNLQVNFIYSIHNEQVTEFQNITSTLGNLNTSGLTVE
ncbi:hypothetical protein [Leptospira vanthielii]|uniref:Uncharacterized protein n=1 Tax=Leptospira vanthielii serovar Holland str. Waz Holland = ATCC 700522 TaxID=1218591 RepID=N1W9H2_9LEPT|nr:hypothetical protein [Leptospira vanthielii]EMY71653.1 hypothetical protein LEP1GSC199_0577 [Leptospira vanthielii serovar Holland str. Waz Holland = ATCC 700522]